MSTEVTNPNTEILYCLITYGFWNVKDYIKDYIPPNEVCTHKGWGIALVPEGGFLDVIEPETGRIFTCDMFFNFDTGEEKDISPDEAIAQVKALIDGGAA